jgi:hypothetical protein
MFVKSFVDLVTNEMKGVERRQGLFSVYLVIKTLFTTNDLAYCLIGCITFGVWCQGREY